MKTDTQIMVKGFLVALILLTGCVKDLDVKPDDPFVLTADDVYTTADSYKSGLAKIYASFILTGSNGGSGNPDVLGVDEGFSCFVRSLWSLNEMTTDEAVWSYPNDANGTIFNLHNHTWVATDGIPQALYARILNVAAISNEFLRVTEGKKEEAAIRTFRAEARFLRTMSYYYGMDLFKTIPFVTEADKPGVYFPPVKTRAELYAFVESELLAIKSDLGEPRFEYGRTDKAVCAMLLAKLYLNSEVYIGTPKYTEAITQLKEVIGGGYVLSPNYLNLFLADNDTNNREIIFAQICDGAFSQSYGMPWIMIYGNAGNDNGWGGLRTTSTFVKKFNDHPNEARALFAKEDKGQSLEIDALNAAKQGYGIFKFRNVKSDGSKPANASSGFSDTDYPMFRLADAYLMYAEAVLRGGTGGDVNTALQYVNAIRTRSGDANAPGAITMTQLTLDFILDERARELYWEGHRRMDLIRFKKFTSGYNWPWKGGVKNGQEDTGARHEFFPIPSTDIATNPNLVQHPEYK